MSSGDEDKTSGKAESEASIMMQAARKVGSRSVSTASESDTTEEKERYQLDTRRANAVLPVFTFVRSSARPDVVAVAVRVSLKPLGRCDTGGDPCEET